MSDPNKSKKRQLKTGMREVLLEMLTDHDQELNDLNSMFSSCKFDPDILHDINEVRIMYSRIIKKLRDRHEATNH